MKLNLSGKKIKLSGVQNPDSGLKAYFYLTFLDPDLRFNHLFLDLLESDYFNSSNKQYVRQKKELLDAISDLVLKLDKDQVRHVYISNHMFYKEIFVSGLRAAGIKFQCV